MNNLASVSINDVYRMQFPFISKDKKVSAKAMSLVIGKMPKDFDYDKARDEMWEKFAK